jgi:hypothetical protein
MQLGAMSFAACPLAIIRTAFIFTAFVITGESDVVRAELPIRV